MELNIAMELIKKGKGNIYVNLTKRTCIYKYKSKETPIEIPQLNIASMKEVSERIEELYAIYYESNCTDYDRKETYFYAKPFAELTDENHGLGECRNVARANLEIYILQMILNGSYVWKSKRYFWVSKKYPTLIIKSKWIKGE